MGKKVKSKHPYIQTKTQKSTEFKNTSLTKNCLFGTDANLTSDQLKLTLMDSDTDCRILATVMVGWNLKLVLKRTKSVKRIVGGTLTRLLLCTTLLKATWKALCSKSKKLPPHPHPPDYKSSSSMSGTPT